MKQITMQDLAERRGDNSSACVGETILGACIEELLKAAIRMYNVDQNGVEKINENVHCKDTLAIAWRCGEVVHRYWHEVNEFIYCKSESMSITKRIKETLKNEMAFISLPDKF